VLSLGGLAGVGILMEFVNHTSLLLELKLNALRLAELVSSGWVAP
jgi:hypothetical protein